MEIKIKNKNKERRGLDSELNMRYFKIPLCRSFVWKSEIIQRQMTRVSGTLGQKLGYDNYTKDYVWKLPLLP